MYVKEETIIKCLLVSEANYQKKVNAICERELFFLLTIDTHFDASTKESF